MYSLYSLFKDYYLEESKSSKSMSVYKAQLLTTGYTGYTDKSAGQRGCQLGTKPGTHRVQIEYKQYFTKSRGSDDHRRLPAHEMSTLEEAKALHKALGEVIAGDTA